MKFNKISKRSGMLGMVVWSLILVSFWKPVNQANVKLQTAEISLKAIDSSFKVSLAYWSMYKALINRKINPNAFAEKAKDWEITDLEYVNKFYAEEFRNTNYSQKRMSALVVKCKAKAVGTKPHNVNAYAMYIGHLKAMQIIKDSGYPTCIGVAYQGNEIGEDLRIFDHNETEV